MQHERRSLNVAILIRPKGSQGRVILLLILAAPFVVALSVRSASTATQTPSGDAARGEAVYESACTPCHSIDQDRIGPRHRNVVGRRIASVAGFDYSPALQRVKGVWNRALLDKWLVDPQAVAPGTAMGFRVEDARDRADVIAYLLKVSKADDR
jgi:cytochrome c